MKKITKKNNNKQSGNKFLTNMKDKIKNKGWKSIILSILLIGMITVTSLILVFALYVIISAPSFDKDKLYSKEATIIYDVKGNELARIGKENRTLITYNDLPQVFIDALIATEDSRFFQHNGLDIARFIKASLGQIAGSNAGGASTLSMQLIKKTYTNDEASGIKGIVRKFTDIYMAVFKLENCYTKEEIIEFYANSLWFGHDGDLNYTGIYGIEQASLYFFNKSVRDLNLAEASMLVGMYQNPVSRNPYNHPDRCRERQKTVLRLMVNHGYITEAEMQDVLSIPIESMLVKYEDSQAKNENQVIIDYILQEVEDKTGKDPYSIPMKIYSTINMDVQKQLVRVEKGENFKWLNDKDQTGIVVTSTEDGSIVAMSGGRNYQARGLNRALSRRQPGSTIKPILDYSTYIEYLNGSTGDLFFDDEYKYSDGTKLYDSDKKYMGLISLRTSLINSRNIPALQAFQRIANVDKNILIKQLNNFRLNYGNTLYESASIGSFDGVSPLEMSAAYGVFARGGYYIEPYSFTKVEYENGTTYEYKYTKDKILSEQTCYMITDVLSTAVRTGWCGSINIKGTQVAGKTGTTDIDDNVLKELKIPLGTVRDSWNVTYSPEYIIALWYGYDNLTKSTYLHPNKASSQRYKMMTQLAKNIYSTNKTFKKPTGLLEVEIEKETFPIQLPSIYTPKDMRVTELFKEGTEPTEVSTRYEALNNPNNLNYTLNNNQITLTWDNVSTPNAINNDYLLNHFNENYGTFATKYYEKRIEYNNTNVGTLGYDIYVKNSNGELNYITRVSNNSYTQSVEPGQSYTFVVKTAYSIFKDNASSGSISEVTVPTFNQDITDPNNPVNPTPEPTPEVTE